MVISRLEILDFSPLIERVLAGVNIEVLHSLHRMESETEFEINIFDLKLMVKRRLFEIHTSCSFWVFSTSQI